MDKIDFSGFPFPATPAEGRVALLLMKYAVFGIVPLIVPSILIDVPIPTTRIPAQQGTDLAYIKDLADEGRLCLLSRSGSGAGDEHCLLGAADQNRRSAACAQHRHGRAHQCGVADLFVQQQPQRDSDGLLLRRVHQNRIPIPIPPITPLNPPLGLIPPIPTRLQPVSDDLSKRSLPQAIMIGLAKAAQWAEAVSGRASSTCCVTAAF